MDLVSSIDWLKALKDSDEIQEFYYSDEFCQALDIAINAIKKQIPKKPDCIEDKMWCCPVCDNHLLHKWIKYPTRLMPKAEELPHCMSCGQK